MRLNQREFEKVYENIRKDIKRNNNELRKSRSDNPILVLE
jgi:hypothetical protein